MITGSKKALLDIIKHNGKTSIDEATEVTGLAKTTLREHFSQLEGDGFVLRDFVRHGPGRPSLQYVLTAKGNSLYPSAEPELMRELIRYLKQENEEGLLENFFERFWDKRFEEAKQLLDNQKAETEEEKLLAISKMLEKEGFMPSINTVEDGKVVKIKECNCPFTEVVKETRLPCELEKQFYERIFNKKVERVSYIPDGDHSCSYVIS